MNEIKTQKNQLNSLIEKISALNVLNEVSDLAVAINEMAFKHDYYQVGIPARPDWEIDEIKGKFKAKVGCFDFISFKRYQDPWADVNDGFEFDMTETEFFVRVIKGELVALD